jgi:hypothetical protein
MRRALSLLELVLALAISVVVIGLLTMAVNFQLRTFEKRRDRIEEAALARAILRHISDDLRSAVAYRPVDLQGLDTVAGNAAESTGLPTDALGGAGTDPSSDGGQPNSNSPMATPMSTGNSSPGANPNTSASSATTGQSTDPMMASDTTTLASPGAGAYVAGLYGDQYSIQFDMSRLPRLDEYQSIVLDSGQIAITQIPTDIRTISYYLAGSTPITQAAAAQARATGMASAMPLSAQTAMLPPVGQGLVRQEQDRSVASYGNVSMDLSDMTRDTGEDLLAEEVTRLEFKYFDGYQWWPSWDSDLRGGLPMAIEILIGLPDRKTTPTNAPAATVTQVSDPLDTPKELFYRLVVRIPTGEPLDPAEAGMMMEEAAASEDSATGAASAPASGFGAGGMP